MISKAIEIFLRAAPPAPALLSRSSAKAFVHGRRFYAVKSTTCCSLQPPNVERLAETARISLSPQQVEEFAPKIQQVVDWFGQLQDVDLQSVEPALKADTEEDNLRNDVPEVFDNREAMISAVPSYEDSYIKVPKVLNKE